ncbi:MAG: nitrogenase [Desulfarculus sp.]|nr:nitrogenase [Desulfarculus sp.]
MSTAPAYVSTTNACKACMPLGACLAFKGVEGCVPFLHGSQGCATYMRRYLISHYREPVDIASSSLGEKQAIYGGGPNLKQGLVNVMNKYQAQAIGVATTCLTETIGDDVPGLVREFMGQAKVEGGASVPPVIAVSTPSFGGTHLQGFHRAVAALVDQLATAAGPPNGQVNLLPGLVSPADARYLKEVLADFGLTGVLLPDLSLTLDGVAKAEYELIPEGGTPLRDIAAMGSSAATIQLGCFAMPNPSAGQILASRFGVPLVSLNQPLGLRASDTLFQCLERHGGRPTPERHARERGQLLDAFVDGHKYLAGVKAVVYGEEDLVLGLCSFLAEVGVQVVLAASGGQSPDLAQAVAQASRGLAPQDPQVRSGVDFYQIGEEARALQPDILIGNSKGHALARQLRVPLLRVGFPIHDRFGAGRIQTLGYRGALSLLDVLINTLLKKRQADNPVGYGYL